MHIAIISIFLLLEQNFKSFIQEGLMPQLTKEQIDVYNSDGFITPLDIYTAKEAAALRQELED